MSYRRTLLAGICALPLAAWAQQRRPQKEYLLVGVATSLFDSGFAQRIRTAVAHSTGLAIQVTPGASGKLLALLEHGEIDVAITHAPELELQLEGQGLAHDRRFVASNDFVIAGPVERPAPVKGKKKAPPPKDPLDLIGTADASQAFARIAAAGAQGAARFVAPLDRSGAQLKELSLWKAAGVAPQGAWYQRSGTGMGETLAQANAQSAYVLVDRATWLTSSQRGDLAIVVEGDRRLDDVYHVMRSFRVNHPAGKLFVNWLAGPAGRRVVADAPGGFRAAPRTAA